MNQSTEYLPSGLPTSIPIISKPEMATEYILVVILLALSGWVVFMICMLKIDGKTKNIVMVERK